MVDLLIMTREVDDFWPAVEYLRPASSYIKQRMQEAEASRILVSNTQAHLQDSI